MRQLSPLKLSFLIIFLFTIFFYLYGPRGINLVLFLLNIGLIIYFIYNKIFFIPFKLYILFLILLSTTIVGYFYNESFSSWQIIRSHIWLPLSMVILLNTKAIINKDEYSFFDINKICEFIKFYSLGILFLYTVDQIFNLKISPNIFYFSETNIYTRYAYPLIEPILIFIPILIIKNYKKTVILLLLLSLVTLTKTIIFTGIFFLFTSAFFLKNNDDNKKFIKQILFFYFIFLIIIFIIDKNIFFSRIENLLNYNTSTRYDQINEFKNYINESSFKMFKLLFGSGLGSAYRSINIYGIDDQPLIRALINSQYDIENGFFGLLFLVGILGFLLYFNIVIGYFKKYKMLIFIFFVFSFLGTSPFGLGHLFKIFFLGLMINYFINLNYKND